MSANPDNGIEGMGRPLRIVAIMAAYNEGDIVAQAVAGLIGQGVSVYVLDNWSTDDTAAQVQPFLGRGVLQIERFPRDRPSEGVWDWAAILRRKEELSHELDGDWFIHHDADEFRESPWTGVDLCTAIQAVELLGYNAIDFELYNFVPTHDCFQRDDDVRASFPFFEETERFNKTQIRCWKKGPTRVDLVSTGGHEALFEARNVFPIRFVLRHYPIRGQAHGLRKVFSERKARFTDMERERKWHVQYDNVWDGHRFVRSSDGLQRYDEERIRVELWRRHRLVDDRDPEQVVASHLARLLERFDDLSRRLTSLENLLVARDREIGSLNSELQSRELELDVERRQVAAVNTDLHARQLDLDARRGDVARLCEEVRRWRSRVADAESRLAQVTSAAEEAAAIVRSQREEIRQLVRDRSSEHDRAAAFEHSWSWRLTAPGRWVLTRLGVRCPPKSCP